MAVTKTTRKSLIILAFVLVLVLTAVVSGGVVVLEQSWNISTAASHRLEVLVRLLSITACQDHTSREVSRVRPRAAAAAAAGGGHY